MRAATNEFGPQGLEAFIKNLRARKEGVRLIARVLLSETLLLIAVPVLAHHAFSAEYDAKSPVTLTGRLARLEWVNPHSWIHIETTGPNDVLETWAVETATPNTLLRRGLRKSDLPARALVRVEGYRAKDGSLKAHGVNLTLPDGRRIFLSSPLADIADDQR